MFEFRAHLALEWKLLIRSWYSRFLLLGIVAYAYLSHQMADEPIHMGQYIAYFHKIYSLPFLLFAVFAGVHQAGREQHTGTLNLLEALPYRSTPKLAAKILIGLLPFLVISLVPPGVVLLVSQGMLPSESTTALIQLLLFDWIYLLYSYLLGFLVGTMISGLLAALAAFVVWVLQTFLLHFLVFKNLPSYWHNLNAVFFDLQTNNIQIVEPLSGLDVHLYPWLHRLWFAGISGLMAIMIVAVARKQRRESLRLAVWLPLLIVCTVSAASAAFSYISYGKTRWELYQNRYQQVAALEANPSFHTSDLSYEQPELRGIRIEAYYQGTHQVALQAKLQLQHSESTSGPLHFTLNDTFQVEAVLDSNGSKLHFQRNGTNLVITLPEDRAHTPSSTITIHYRGHMEDWRLTDNAIPILHKLHTAEPNRFYLSGRYGWYPLPGRVKLQEAEDCEDLRVGGGCPRGFSHIKDLTVSNQSPIIPYEIKLHYPDTLSIFSSLGEASQISKENGMQVLEWKGSANAVTLVGGRLKLRYYEGEFVKLRLLVSTLVKDEALDQRLEQLLPFIDEAHRLITEVSGREYTILASEYYTNQGDLTSVIPIASLDLGGMYNGGILFTMSDIKRNWLYRLMEHLLGIPSYDQANTELQRYFLGALAALIENKLYGTPIPNPQYGADEYKTIYQYLNEHSHQENEAYIRELFRKVVQGS